MEGLAKSKNVTRDRRRSSREKILRGGGNAPSQTEAPKAPSGERIRQENRGADICAE